MSQNALNCLKCLSLTLLIGVSLQYMKVGVLLDPYTDDDDDDDDNDDDNNDDDDRVELR